MANVNSTILFFICFHFFLVPFFLPFGFPFHGVALASFNGILKPFRIFSVLSGAIRCPFGCLGETNGSFLMSGFRSRYNQNILFLGYVKFILGFFSLGRHHILRMNFDADYWLNLYNLVKNKHGA